jgi:beta-phosphoglucomutase-like phosphatase (HAD superfamily)
MNILTKLGIYALVLAALYGAWQWHGDSEYKRGRAELAAEVNAKGKEVEAARAALEKAKQQLVDQAITQEMAKAAELEKIREAIKTLDNDRSRTINGLRSTLATYTNEVAPVSLKSYDDKQVTDYSLKAKDSQSKVQDYLTRLSDWSAKVKLYFENKP